MSTGTMDLQPPPSAAERGLDVERDSDVPISTQIYWQLAYQIESGRLQPGERLSPVRELGAALRVNPNTIRAVYRRLSDNGFVVSRHGAGTVVADRSTHRRRPEALGGIVSELLRRAAQAGARGSSKSGRESTPWVWARTSRMAIVARTIRKMIRPPML